ncbi:MAG: TIGR02757 family protein [Treponema sp.]|nr:TIGR02757 family protein [Treponema sp.]
MISEISSELTQKLIFLADKYEKPSFADSDPSQFLRWYPLNQKADVETASFIAAMLAFGNRSQFIPKIRQILELADKISCTEKNESSNITSWIKSEKYKKDFLPANALSQASACDLSKKFYRFYSYQDMHVFFDELRSILMAAPSLGDYFEKEWLDKRGNLYDLISAAFPKSKIVPKGKSSANKRIHMFLRWMVRQKSPVDLGLWSWYPQSKLLIPLDVHVMQEAIKMGLLPEKAAPSHKTDLMLTECMKKVFPEDPCRADYSLFGLGVSM